MDKREARSILERRVAELRQESYESLIAKWLNQPDSEQIRGESGAEYQVKIEAIWDDPREKGETYGCSLPLTMAAGGRCFR